MSTVKNLKWHKLSIYKVFLSIPVFGRRPWCLYSFEKKNGMACLWLRKKGCRSKKRKRIRKKEKRTHYQINVCISSLHEQHGDLKYLVL
jgi:hypothetical protein